MEWGGTTLVLETGKVARQADGAVMVSLGETKVLCTAVAAHSPKPGQDFFPLTVNYQEKAFAAGKIGMTRTNATTQRGRAGSGAIVMGACSRSLMRKELCGRRRASTHRHVAGACSTSTDMKPC